MGLGAAQTRATSVARSSGLADSASGCALRTQCASTPAEVGAGLNSFPTFSAAISTRRDVARAVWRRARRPPPRSRPCTRAILLGQRRRAPQVVFGPRPAARPRLARSAQFFARRRAAGARFRDRRPLEVPCGPAGSWLADLSRIARSARSSQPGRSGPRLELRTSGLLRRALLGKARRVAFFDGPAVGPGVQLRPAQWPARRASGCWCAQFRPPASRRGVLAAPARVHNHCLDDRQRCWVRRAAIRLRSALGASFRREQVESVEVGPPPRRPAPFSGRGAFPAGSRRRPRASARPSRPSGGPSPRASPRRRRRVARATLCAPGLAASQGGAQGSHLPPLGAREGRGRLAPAKGPLDCDSLLYVVEGRHDRGEGLLGSSGMDLNYSGSGRKKANYTGAKKASSYYVSPAPSVANSECSCDHPCIGG